MTKIIFFVSYKVSIFKTFQNIAAVVNTADQETKGQVFTTNGSDSISMFLIIVVERRKKWQKKWPK